MAIWGFVRLVVGIFAKLQMNGERSLFDEPTSRASSWRVIMYQEFGAREVDNTRTARFRLFIPDNALEPDQYSSGGSPNIDKVHVIGDFESGLGKTDWKVDPAFELKRSKFTDPEDRKT